MSNENKTINSFNTDFGSDMFDITCDDTKNISSGSVFQKSIISIPTSQSFSGSVDYTRKLPSGADVFIQASAGINSITNNTIKEKVRKLVFALRVAIEQMVDDSQFEYYFSRLHFTNKEEDGSTLVEWNFDSFRLGFAFEVDDDMSSYYRIIHSASTNAFKIYSDDMSISIDKLAYESINFIMENI